MYEIQMHHLRKYCEFINDKKDIDLLYFGCICYSSLKITQPRTDRGVVRGRGKTGPPPYFFLAAQKIIPTRTGGKFRGGG